MGKAINNDVKNVQYVCEACGCLSNKWQGRCTVCLSWNTVNSVDNKKKSILNISSPKLWKIGEKSDTNHYRYNTGFDELNRVLGGGLVHGSSIILGGDPGIGKTSLLLQALGRMKDYKSVYVSAEESIAQISEKARRLGIHNDNLSILETGNLSYIVNMIEQEQPNIVVVDSIQSIANDDVPSLAGSVIQIKECSSILIKVAKALNISVFMIGHITKDGSLAGPRILEHLVDTVLYFEGERDSLHRTLRTFKNRFGSVNELGIFIMQNSGLKELKNPSSIFLSNHSTMCSGSSITAIQAASKSILIEIQALVSKHKDRDRGSLIALGMDSHRLLMIKMILNKYTDLDCMGRDIFVNIVGGLKCNDTSMDLSILFSIVSSILNKPISNDTVCFGEIGLSGELRPISRGQERLKEAAKLGFKRAIIPKGNCSNNDIPGITVYPATNIKQSIALLTEQFLTG